MFATQEVTGLHSLLPGSRADGDEVRSCRTDDGVEQHEHRRNRWRAMRTRCETNQSPGASCIEAVQ
jgi:hypothetical protein